MSSNTPMPLERQLTYLAELAQKSLRFWDVPAHATVQLINVSENVTYLVEAEGYKSILRIHRPGYHTRRAIECEILWSQALNKSGGVATPAVHTGKDGQVVQSATIDGLPEPRFMVLFEFVDGVHPNETQDLTGPFEELGEIAARTHIHSINWQRPEPFERLVWDSNAVFGAAANWGDWRDAPHVTPGISAVLSCVEQCVIKRLQAFGQNKERFGLIHADMRLANLLIEGDDTRLIDFDDCGFGWFLYDFAAAISFIEDHPQVPQLKQSWLKGYRKVRAISAEEERELDSFIMLRRLALLAWIGSHIEAPEPQALAEHFARNTAKLGAAYLEIMG